MEHQCKHEGKIASLDKTVSQLEKAIYGNGRKGLMETTTELNMIVTELNDTVKTLATGVSGLTQFRDETIGGIKAKERNRINQRWIIGLLISLLGIVLTSQLI